MDRPQGGGMERVSLMTLLQEDKHTQKDRQKQKKEMKRGKEKERVSHDYYFLIVITENALYELDKKKNRIKIMRQ